MSQGFDRRYFFLTLCIISVYSEINGKMDPDTLLPIANVGRIMKNTLPPSAKVSGEARALVQTCVTELIAFVTSEASEGCLLEKRKTVTGEDVLSALVTLGFDHYAAVLTIYLARYRGRNNPEALEMGSSNDPAGMFMNDEEDDDEEDEDELNGNVNGGLDQVTADEELANFHLVT